MTVKVHWIRLGGRLNVLRRNLHRSWTWMNENYMATFEIQTGDFVSILGYDMMICIYIYYLLIWSCLEYHWSTIIPYLQLTCATCAICFHGKIPDISDDPRDPKYCFNILWLQVVSGQSPGSSCKTRGLIPFWREVGHVWRAIPITQPTQDCRFGHHQPTQSCTFLACSPWRARGWKGHRRPRIGQRIRVPCRSNSLSWSPWISEAFLQVMDEQIIFK